STSKLFLCWLFSCATGLGPFPSAPTRSSLSAIHRVATNWQQAKRRLPRARTRRLTDRHSCDSPNVVSVPSFSTRLPTTNQSPLFVATPFPFSPIALKHREQERGCALRLCGLLLRCRACTGFGSSRSAGTRQESRPWHLGAASRSRPPGGVP